MDPPRIYFFIRGSKVAVSLFSPTGSKSGITNFFFESRSIPPKSQICDRGRSLLFFRRTRKVPSISTTISCPPIESWFPSQNSATSLQKERQSTDVLGVIFKQLVTVWWSHRLLNQWFTNRITFHGGMWEFCKNVPL